MNKKFGKKIYFKCENFQKVGAFKARGALNAVLSLSPDKASKGVATHSSGNHGAALAFAARIKNIPARIVMPENAPNIKQKAVKNYDGIIHFCKPTMEAREKSLEKLVQETGSVFIHPYNNNKVIAGQGTLALEILKQINRLDTLLVPVGGGGLISGISLVCSSLKPDLNLVGVEPKMADDAYQSVKKGVIIPSNYPNTIADGLRTSLGDITFHIIQKYVDKIIRVQEESIIKAMRMVWERMKIIIEPSAAVCLAALMDHLDALKGENIGMVLTGGNVDLDNLPFCNGGSNEL